MLAVPTACPFCSCGCGFYLLVREGRLVGVAPSETHPVSQGKLCARAWSAHEAPVWGQRLLQPMLRRNGRLETISWDEAFECVAIRLGELTTAGKAVGVLGSARATNEENYLAGKFARVCLRTNNVDFSYRSICAPLLEGIEEATGKHTASICLNDITSSQIIVLIEGDLAETHPRAASLVLKAIEKGARLVTIGYRKTQMARLAAFHLRESPGNRGEIIDSLSTAVLDLGRKEPRSAQSVDDTLPRYLQGIATTPEVRRVAEWIVQAERAAFLIAPGAGEPEQLREEAAEFAMLALRGGHLQKPGSGLLPILARSNATGACDMGVVPDRLPGYEPYDDVQARHRVERVWGRELPSPPGLCAENLVQSVRGMVVLADDPPSILPTPGRARSALEKLEFLVVLDSFVTPVTQIAHVVMPIAAFTETEGTYTNMEGRLQRLRAPTNPAGHARNGWKVLAQLCAKWGADSHYSTASDVLNEIGQAAPRYAGMEPRVDENGWGGGLLPDLRASRFTFPSSRAITAAVRTSAEYPYLLIRDGTFEWRNDPLVSFSPTLSRPYRSERKLFPDGFVEMHETDTAALGPGGTRRVRLRSVHGDAVVPVVPKTDLEPGMLSVPYMFRERVCGVLGNNSVVAVSVERA